MSRRAQWRTAELRRDESRALAERLAVNPVVVQVLLNRDVVPADMAAFLDPARAERPDPGLLVDLDRAAERLAMAVRERQKTVIYGDYDADGCCAGALLTRFLQRSEVPCEYYVPDRFDEGYGVNAAALINLITRQKPQLIVTVDCGIGSASEIDTAVSLGIDVIVTDHHQVPERVPTVPAVNPHRPESSYPFRDLCGAAVVYKLCQRTLEVLGRSEEEFGTALLELAMIGTVADVMPLVGENRNLTWRGLDALRRTSSRGLKALIDVAGMKDRPLAARDVAFGIGPRINAAGRLESADLAYRLLVTDDNADAYDLAEQLDRLNRERRELESRLHDEAALQVTDDVLARYWGLVVAGEGWHEGVLGLVAGRLSRQHHRPVLALAIGDETVKGSGRSTPAVNLHAALEACQPLLERFGGHPRAAGLSLAKGQLEALREQFDAAVKTQITEDDLAPVLNLECAIKGSAVSLALAEELARLAPFGEGNPEPLLEIRGLRIADARVTRDGVHLQLQFAAETARGTQELKGFWPRMGRHLDRLQPGAEATVAGAVTIDTWQNRRTPQILVEDLRLGPRG